jgi:hypothetical protein
LTDKNRLKRKSLHSDTPSTKSKCKFNRVYLWIVYIYTRMSGLIRHLDCLHCREVVGSNPPATLIFAEAGSQRFWSQVPSISKPGPIKSRSIQRRWKAEEEMESWGGDGKPKTLGDGELVYSTLQLQGRFLVVAVVAIIYHHLYHYISWK